MYHKFVVISCGPAMTPSVNSYYSKDNVILEKKNVKFSEEYEHMTFKFN